MSRKAGVFYQFKFSSQKMCLCLWFRVLVWVWDWDLFNFNNSVSILEFLKCVLKVKFLIIIVILLEGVVFFMFVLLQLTLIYFPFAFLHSFFIVCILIYFCPHLTCWVLLAALRLLFFSDWILCVWVYGGWGQQAQFIFKDSLVIIFFVSLPFNILTKFLLFSSYHFRFYVCVWAFFVWYLYVFFQCTFYELNIFIAAFLFCF